MENTADNSMPGAWYLGEFEFTVDNQRRVAIPRPWRSNDEDERFFALPGREKSLQVVPGAMFQELLAKLRKVSFADAQAARAMATIGSMALECAPDKQGRITLSNKLMDHAGLSKRVLLIGAVTSIQIWDPATWQERQMDSETGLDVLQAVQERPDELTDILRNRGQD